MVIDVKEAQTVLTKDQEESVNEFPHLADEEEEENPGIEASEKRIVTITKHFVEIFVISVAKDAESHSDGAEQGIDEHNSVMNNL